MMSYRDPIYPDKALDGIHIYIYITKRVHVYVIEVFSTSLACTCCMNTIYLNYCNDLMREFSVSLKFRSVVSMIFNIILFAKIIFICK